MRMVPRDDIWSRDGGPLEELPDPFVTEQQLHDSGLPLELDEGALKPKRKRRWPLALDSIAGLMFITLIWLVIPAPLSRALEPLRAPALLILSDDGHPIARRGALKEAPVEVAKLNSLTPAAFIA